MTHHNVLRKIRVLLRKAIPAWSAGVIGHEPPGSRSTSVAVKMHRDTFPPALFPAPAVLDLDDKDVMAGLECGQARGPCACKTAMESGGHWRHHGPQVGPLILPRCLCCTLHARPCPHLYPPSITFTSVKLQLSHRDVLVFPACPRTTAPSGPRRVCKPENGGMQERNEMLPCSLWLGCGRGPLSSDTRVYGHD